MIIEGEDGVTHINIYSKAKTDLGKWLSNFTHEPFTMPHKGEFNTIEGYWYWLQCGDNRLRTLNGFKCKELGKQLIDEKSSALPPKFVDNIKAALDLKLKVNNTRPHQFSESYLPFCHYYEYGGKRVDSGYEWIVEHFEDRRKLIKDYFDK